MLVSANVSDGICVKLHSTRTDLRQEAGPRLITRGWSWTLKEASVTCTCRAESTHQPELSYREVFNEVTGLSLHGGVVSNEFSP